MLTPGHASLAAFRRGIAPGAVLTLLLTTSFTAQQQDPPPTVNLAWDANLDATAGYRVRVGTQSGVYSETFDVGPAIHFHYATGVSGRRYFFVVVAYDASGRESPHSNEISIVVGDAGATATRDARSDHSVAAYDQSITQHATSRDANDPLGVITGVAVLPDGRALFIEDTRRVRVVAAGGVVSTPALTLPSSDVTCTEVVTSPSFDHTGFVFIGIAELLRDGSREFRVVRYRLVGGVLGEGATIVSGLSYRGEHPPRFTVDDGARVYVAMPGTDDSRREMYATRVLRFGADGSVPRESRASSPVIASGLRAPADVDWQHDALWLVGTDERFPQSVARLPLGSSDEVWPRPLLDAKLPLRDLGVTAFDAITWIEDGQIVSRALLIDSTHAIHRVQFRDGEAVGIASVPWSSEAVPMDVAIGAGGHVYVVTKDAAGAFAILELKDRP